MQKKFNIPKRKDEIMNSFFSQMCKNCFFFLLFLRESEIPKEIKRIASSSQTNFYAVRQKDSKQLFLNISIDK